MALSPIPGAKPWPPGVSGNPAGRAKLPEEIRIARRENMVNLIKLVQLYVGMTDEQAKERLDFEKGTQLEEMIQGQIMRAKEGDGRTFQYLMEVICGKVPESDDHPSISSTLTAKEKLQAVKKLTAALESEVANESRPVE